MTYRRGMPLVRGLGLGLALQLGMLETAGGASEPPPSTVFRVVPPGVADSAAYHDLATALADADSSTVIRVAAGVYDLVPQALQEPTCGNCEVESTRVESTVGLRISGSRIRIVGPRYGQPDPVPGDSSQVGEAVIRTHAGYGILFENCQDCALQGITITAGERDTSANAADAAVVVKRSRVTIEQCTLRDNIGDTTIVARTKVGIMGIVGREESNLVVKKNHIIRNSWDGIALYRGASATIEGNVIDGVDLARGKRIGGGRGVGIGVTWNATASIRGNLVKRYWKGIGAFVDAQVMVEENVVEEVATWGLTLWDAGRGKPSGIFERNVVYRSGACGASFIRAKSDPPFPGRFVQNVLVETGQDPRYDSGEPYCFQEPIARHAAPESFIVSDNLLYANRTSGDHPAAGDLDDQSFRAKLEAIREKHARWPWLAQSDFWTAFKSPKP